MALSLSACTRDSSGTSAPGASGVETDGGTRRAGLAADDLAADDLAAIGPFDRSLPERAPRAFSGDPDPGALHEALWNPVSFLRQRGGLPEVTERVPVVIVGGGMSGLFSAYHLRQHRWVLLEQGPRLGGNSRGESFGDLDYSIGAAYLARPSPNTPWAALLDEIGASALGRVSAHPGTVGLRGKVVEGFWEGAGVPAAQQGAVTRLGRYLRQVFEGVGGHTYPEIPCTTDAHRQVVNGLDRQSFAEHVRALLGAEPRGALRTLLEHYCWSTLGGGTAELSAAAVLTNIAAEFGEMVALPGGNGRLVECLLERLSPTLAPDSLRTRSLVIDVRRVPAGVHVTYVDAQGTLRTIEAAVVILACPKFVVKRILQGIEPERAAAIAKIHYRSYLVANVLLRGAPRHDLHGLYLLGDGETDFSDLTRASERSGYTDLVLANFARPHPERTVLTLYRPLPFDGARAQMLSPGYYDSVRQDTERQVVETVLPMMGFLPGQLHDLRLSRWGHPIPLCRPGLIAEGLPEAVGRPFAERVLFAEQDTWLSPWVEAAAEQARIASDAARKLIAS